VPSLPCRQSAAVSRSGTSARRSRSTSERSGETIRPRRSQDEIIQRLTGVIQRRFQSIGQEIHPASAGARAAASVGVAIHVCHHALDHDRDRDLDAAAAVAAVFTESAFRALDPQALAPDDKIHGTQRR
jgi:hypothetical protein